MIILSKDNCLITGRVTKNGGEMKYVGQDNKPMYQFSVCFQNKKLPSGKWDSKYMTCKVFGNRAMVAPKLAGSEDVFCCGEFRRNKFPGKDGNEKESLELFCDFILLASAGNQQASAPQGFQEMDDMDNEAEFPF